MKFHNSFLDQSSNTVCESDKASIFAINVKDGDKDNYYLCSVFNCKYSAKQFHDVMKHIRIHTDEKPFCCQYCDKKFTRTDKLKVHERIHTGEKPYKCTLCSYTCCDSGSLRKHVKIHQ